MKNALFLSAIFLLILPLISYGNEKNTTIASDLTQTEQVTNNTDTLKQKKEPNCISGGYGAKSCGYKARPQQNLTKNINLPNGTIGYDCEVMCLEFAYACCGPDGCICIPYTPKKQ